MPKRNLAARAGYWSAKHRKIAIGGWLAFVVAAFILGGAIGTNTLADEDSGNGESRVADTAIHDANFPDKSDEQVLVQSRDGKLNLADPAVKAGVDDVVARLEKAKHVQDVKSPLAKGNEGQISEDGRSALITFSLPDPEEGSDEIVDASLAATAAAQKANPDLRIEQFGDSSADKALGAALDDDFKRAEFLSPPDHAADPDRRLRRAGRRRRAAAAGDHGRDRHARPRRPDQPDRPDGGVRELGDPADRSSGRRRLLDVLPTPQDGGARRRTIAARRRSSSPPPPPARRCSSPA